MHPICVVYLARARSGLRSFERFFQSYRQHKAGLAHDLVIVFKGFSNAAEKESRRALIKDLSPETLSISDYGFDLRAYSIALRHFANPYFCCLNSFSELLADDWLAKLYAALQPNEVGLVGATGSHESMYTNVLVQRERCPDASLLTRMWTPLRLQLCRMCFDPFPNYHLRTNGFLISREVMLKVWPRIIVTKRGAYLFENGKNSLTKRVLKTKRDVRVVGRDGVAFHKEQWPQSRTFRSGRQENLLIADNQTRQYDTANETLRNYLRTVTWGDAAVPEPDTAPGE